MVEVIATFPGDLPERGGRFRVRRIVALLPAEDSLMRAPVWVAGTMKQSV
jgi:hypothetical protein